MIMKKTYTLTWQGRLANMPEFQLPEPTALMSAKNYKTKIVEPLIQKLKKAILDITAKYYEMRNNYYDFSGRIKGLANQNDDLERINYGIREEIAVLKEDVKDLKTIKRAMGREGFEELLNTAMTAKAAKTAFKERERER